MTSPARTFRIVTPAAVQLRQWLHNAVRAAAYAAMAWQGVALQPEDVFWEIEAALATLRREWRGLDRDGINALATPKPRWPTEMFETQKEG